MEEITYSENIVNEITHFPTEDEWNFSFDDQRGLFRFTLSIEGKIKKLDYIIDVREDEYIVYAISPIGADKDDKEIMASMAEFICRVNYGMRNGNFEFDMEDGEVRFKSYVDCDGSNPTAAIIKNSIYCPAVIFDNYENGIADIIFNHISAKEAEERCERAIESD